ncbi:MAG: hypothetical protein ACI8PZ_005140 [Myxococcota bacterium]
MSRALLVSLFLLLGCGGGEEKITEQCGNATDDDGDGLVDCLDDDCDDVCTEQCDDGIDNDSDGLRDCFDDDCDGQCPEDCIDGRDNDGDGAIDCADEDCFGFCPEICDDGVDNDADGLVDCVDPNCFGICDEICGDGIDNDLNGVADCNDAACDGGCPEDMHCSDGRDNDGDGAIDCADPDCDGRGCREADWCDDGRDNDGDGAIDCSDLDCVNPDTCPEDCTDEVDNDGDGLLDCLDPDCDGECPEWCIDGRDNDGDGLVDLDDPQCDEDGDGFAPESRGGEDCNDRAPGTNPGAEDICEDGIDQDCDGVDDLCIFYRGSYDVADGPALSPYYGGGEPVYNCVEACAEVFGGSPDNYVCSLSAIEVTSTGNYGEASGGCDVLSGNDDLDGCETYDPGRGCDVSAYASFASYFYEYGCPDETNHCWVVGD